MNIFNPEHDLCLANGDPNFVPPFSALEFAEDCAGLTRWIDEAKDDEVIPWGWDSHLKCRLLKQGIDEKLMPSDEELRTIRELSKRGVALEAENFIRKTLTEAELEFVRSDGDVVELSDMESVIDMVGEYGDAVLKAPLSGSGKGLRWARADEMTSSDLGWCRKIIAKQGSVTVERRHKVVQDFAMLFRVGATGEVLFEGLSMFFNDNGIYKGNVLASDDYILEKWSSYVDEALILKVRTALTMFLAGRFSGRYCGYVGVDMFEYESDGGFRLAPCVEMNVRMTMGLLARRIFDRSDYVSGDYVMTVEYSPADGELYRKYVGEENKTLTRITPSSHYAVVIRSRGSGAQETQD